MLRTTTQVLACVDGSTYLESVCQHAAWLAVHEGANVHVLNVQTAFHDWPAPATYADAIGMAGLVDQFTELEATHNRLEQQKSDVVVKRAQVILGELGVSVAVTQQIGALVDAIAEHVTETSVLVVGKRGEHADYAIDHLGSNLERVIRAATVPVMIAAPDFSRIRRVALAYDGGGNAYKALEYIMHHPAFADVEVHVLGVGHTDEFLEQHLHKAEGLLLQAQRSVVMRHLQGDPAEVIQGYVAAHDIDLLMMGAYSHSALHHWFIGSTTNELLRLTRASVMLFR